MKTTNVNFNQIENKTRGARVGEKSINLNKLIKFLINKF